MSDLSEGSEVEGFSRQRLRLIRLRRGMTQRDAAAAAGVGQDTVSGLEVGWRNPRPSTLRKLAAAYDVDVDAFFDPTESDADPKAEGRQVQTAAANWFQSWMGHSYLAMSHKQAKKIANSAQSLEEIRELKEATDDEQEVAQEFLEHHDPDPELREALEESIRQKLYWRIDLAARRHELREEGKGEDESTRLVGMHSRMP